ncbi:MAG: TraR/DksA C4-type zinc finger protein [Acidimicrobiales bacterium]
MPRATKSSDAKKTPSKKQATKAEPAPKAAAAKAAPKKAAAKAPAGKKAAAGSTADKFLESQRELLLEERDLHTRQAAGLRAEAEQLAEERDPGDVQFDEESGQGDTMNVERERDLALSAQALQQVQEIDTALAKMDKGTYGLCERCGQPIPKERLKALPWAALDVSCKSMGFARR